VAANGHVRKRLTVARTETFMYRAGPTKFVMAAIMPANALAITKVDSTLGGLKTVLQVFEVLLGVWLFTMFVTGSLAMIFKRKPDLRTPRVTLPPKQAVRGDPS
jgi:uncharacterized membrane protein